MGSIWLVVLAMAPADGFVPTAPAPAPGSASEAAESPPVQRPTSVTDLAPAPKKPRSTADTFPQRIRPATEAPPAPEPRGSTPPADEIGGFMERPPPTVPVSAEDQEVGTTVAPPTGNLVWGLHRPVARWKRDGLIGSIVLTGVSLATAIGTRIEGQRRLDEVGRYLDENRGSPGLYQGGSSFEACEQVSVGKSGGVVVVSDVGLAHRCQRFNRMKVALGVSKGLAVVGLLSTATFAVLHFVRRDDEPRRVQARADGVAVRF